MQFNQTYVPDEATVQVNEPMEQIYYNQVLLQNCLPFPDSPAVLDTLLHGESVAQFQQNSEQTMNKQTMNNQTMNNQTMNNQTMNNLSFKGHRSSGMPLTNRREKNRERERKRQTRLKGAFNVLRSVIPDYFSEREPGDRLSRIQTLRLAKKYIATLHELLETC